MQGFFVPRASTLTIWQGGLFPSDEVPTNAPEAIAHYGGALMSFPFVPLKPGQPANLAHPRISPPMVPRWVVIHGTLLCSYRIPVLDVLAWHRLRTIPPPIEHPTISGTLTTKQVTALCAQHPSQRFNVVVRGRYWRDLTFYIGTGTLDDIPANASAAHSPQWVSWNGASVILHGLLLCVGSSPELEAYRWHASVGRGD